MGASFLVSAGLWFSRRPPSCPALFSVQRMLQRHKGPLHILPGRVMILLVMLRLGVAHPVRRDKDRNGAVVHRLDDPRAVLLGILQRQRRQRENGSCTSNLYIINEGK